MLVVCSALNTHLYFCRCLVRFNKVSFSFAYMMLTPVGKHPDFVIE